ncbi:uncharacterized protein PITG_04849 [Phytophthora infestans T30-4]|uniref:Tyrosine-protein kinase ephrin type A/B receptor-like domain-containing protein n=1 Tax=Phytophthora infestans (strain T30-4) TaxID=403677 RepID=D0N264_PHYIT|nr:uncharacterized protein PITG_04849 [Phytophthora infestans T30-4]EEY68393.1 conserved hypothetical protein [Phytophthora infestans T30-4]|eukprot:XP_002905552.1 conserved hypothetical protein [Phytophthora infestans T30-4]
MGNLVLRVSCCIIALIPTTEALACNAGAYFDGAKCLPCPGGTFGAVPGLASSSCSGLCTAGFFCPKGSTSSREKLCGASTFYCPSGSAERHPVDEGYYTVTFPTDQSDLPSSAGEQIRCDKGYYCVLGTRRACPAGVFGESTRVTTPECSASCPKGSYCPEATVVPIPCPPGTYGGEIGLTSAQCSGLCPIGHYCTIGTITPEPCPSGTYGATPGLISSACSSTCSTVNKVLSCLPSPCPAGYYCALATTVPQECGSVEKFCPTGSSAPTTAAPGYYTTWKAYTGTSVTGEQLALQYVEGNSLAIRNQTTRSNQHICEKGSYCSGGVKRLCPAGTYGATDGLSTATCTALCPAGFYCPSGTADFSQHPCTLRSSFCRQGSSVPTAVDSGYFTVATQTGLRSDETICPPGSFCVGGVQYLCPEGTFGATFGLASKTTAIAVSGGVILSKWQVLCTLLSRLLVRRWVPRSSATRMRC